MRLLAAIPLLLVAATSAAAEPAPRATVLHVPVAEAEPRAPIELVAAIDGAWAEPVLLARWRIAGEPTWHDAPFEASSAGGWYAILPATASVPPGVEYYIVGVGAAGEVAHFATARDPQPIRIEPTLADRLEAADEARLGGRTESLAVDVDGHDFGNRYRKDDAFLRAELRWTHRVSRTLHGLGFGFGSIWGRTPDGEGRGADVETTLARYGFAAVRVRAHPSVYLDGRLALGVSHDGFTAGTAGAITFGRPWRSNLSLGADYLGDLGGTGYVRLQWDTATPLLMGASIVRTDLPGAVLEANGLYVKYDVQWTVRPALTVRGAISYGSRDGSGRVGGGLGVQTDF